MTVNKDFKRVVRFRMKRTGETYMQARAAILAMQPTEFQQERDAAKKDRNETKGART